MQKKGGRSLLFCNPPEQGQLNTLPETRRDRSDQNQDFGILTESATIS